MLDSRRCLHRFLPGCGLQMTVGWGWVMRIKQYKSMVFFEFLGLVIRWPLLSLLLRWVFYTSQALIAGSWSINSRASWLREHRLVMLKEIWRFWAKITTSFLSCSWRPSSKQPQCLSPESSYFFNLSIHPEPLVVGAGVGCDVFLLISQAAGSTFSLEQWKISVVWVAEWINYTTVLRFYREMKSPILWEYLSKPTGIYMESHQKIPSKTYVPMCFPWVFVFFFSLCAGKCALRRHNPPHPFHQFGVHEVSTEEHHWFQRQRGVQKCHVLPGQWWQAQLSLASVPLELLRKRQGKFDHSHNLRPTWRPFDRHVPSPLPGSWYLLGHGCLLHQWQLWRPHPKRAWRICHNMPLKFCQHQIEVDPCKERHSESYKWRVEVSIQMQVRVLMCSKSCIQVTFERGVLLSLVLFFTKSSNMIHNYYSL